MKKFLLTISIFLTCFLGFSQEKISVADIYNGRFYAHEFDKLYHLKNGKEFAKIEYSTEGKTKLVAYDYQTNSPQRILVETPDIIEDFQVHPLETKILLGSQIMPLYRKSKLGIYQVYNIETKQFIPIFEQPIQEPLLSPDANKVAFVFENNIYVRDLQTLQLTQVTTDGKLNETINGLSDWVYEEEFSVVRMFDWSPDSQWIAFLKFDESQVPEFSMDIYGEGLYPQQAVFKYPKAGEKLSKVSLWAYSLKNKNTLSIPTNANYIPRLEWAKKGNVLSFQTLNRHQNNFNLVYFDVVSKTSKIVYSETDERYVELPTLAILSDNSFLITSEKNGFNHIYYFQNNGKLKKQITQGNWDVTDLYGINENSKTIFYQSTEKGSIQRNVFSIHLNGKNKTLLTPKNGTNEADFSSDFSYFVATHESSTEPYSAIVFKTKGIEKVKELINNSHLVNVTNKFSTSRKEFQEIKLGDYSVNMWLLKPANFDPSKKYPVLLYQYSGPGSQSVKNDWLSHDDYWYLSLTQKGYIVACVDGRGTGFKGANFKKQTYLQLGKFETEDQIKTANYLATLPFIDKNRIGIWGWSFGGFISTNALLKGNSVFKMAIAVAPVTSWEFYDAIYTERFMRTPSENPSGYKENSPLYFAKNLKGKYLLVHGSADDNVHIQHTMRMVEELIQKNKPFDWAIYPDKNHSIYGGKTREHLFEKLTQFIENNL